MTMTIESRYTLASSLEQGRFGTMYRAASKDRGDEVVVWVLPPEFTHHGPTRAAFLRDLERIRGLAHPNIARVLDIGQDGDRLFVVSEWTDGETLRNVIDALGAERLQLHEADSIIEAVGSALAYAHERGIVHGDVRAENIAVTNDQRIKLANFMLSSLARNTPFAPAPFDDTRALAALAYELYCGIPPRRDVNASALRELPRQRRKAVAMGMSASAERPISVTDFMATAGLARDGLRLVARPVPEPAEARRGFSPLRLAIAIAGLIALGTALQIGVEEVPPASPNTNTVAAELDEAAALPADAVASEQNAEHVQTALESPPGSPAATDHAPIAPAPQAGHEPASNEAAQAPSEPAARLRSPTLSPAVAAVAAVPAPQTPPPSRSAAAEHLTLSGYTVTVYEDQGTARLDITRAANLEQPLDFIWWTSDGTARADEDYAAFGARLETFGPNEAERSIYIPLVSDAVAEGPESFFVHVSVDRKTGSNNNLKLTAEVHIIDDDF